MGKKRIVCALKDGEKQILGFRLPLRLATTCAAKLHTLRIVAFAVFRLPDRQKNNSLGKETKELYRFKSNQRIYERIHDETFYEIFGAVDGARTRDHRRDRPVL